MTSFKHAISLIQNKKSNFDQLFNKIWILELKDIKPLQVMPKAGLV